MAIRTDYLIAYAFAAPYDDASQGMWFGEIKGFAYSVNCSLYDQGYLAPDYSNPAAVATGPDPHRPEYYFDPAVPIPQSSNC